MVERALASEMNRRGFIKRALGGLVLASPIGQLAEIAEIQRDQTQQFLDIVRAEKPRHPENIPDRTVIDILGLSVLSGIENPEQTIEDMKTLDAASILYMGSDEKFISTLSDSEAVKSPDKRTLIITRYLSPDNSNKIHWPGFRHTVHMAKEYIGKKCQERPIVEIFNEANIYPGQNRITPQEHANDFMTAAEFVIDNGCTPLLPPFAPHTGTELAWYANFLQAISDSSEDLFNKVASRLQVSLHGYARYRFDDPFMHHEYTATLLRNTFKKQLPVHYTEFGLTMGLADRLGPVKSALELKRGLERPLPDSFPIASINLWALAAKAPIDPGAENYENQVLRISDVGTTTLFTAVAYTKEKRKQDLARKRQYEETLLRLR